MQKSGSPKGAEWVRTLLYGVAAFFLARSHHLNWLDDILQERYALPLAPFRLLILLLFLAGAAVYAVRWARKSIRRLNPMLLCLAGLLGYLQLITLLYGGYNAYTLDFAAAFALSLLLDMGLQCEKKSVLRGMAGALELWVYMNLAALLLWPKGAVWIFSAKDFRPQWLLGSHIFYYRTLLPALGLCIVRDQALHGRWTARTYLMLAVCTATVALQGGGTAMLGYMLFAGMLLWCNRRALPRWMSPMPALAASAALLAGILCFNVQQYFAFLIEGILHKSLTLTNRIYIWPKVLEVIRNYPVTGIGYTPLAYTRSFLNNGDHTHNQLLELLMRGGVIALGLYIGMVYLAGREALAHRRSAAVKTAALLLSAFILMGTAEIFQHEALYYPMFMLVFRGRELSEGAQRQPAITVFARVKRDCGRIFTGETDTNEKN